MKLAFGTVQDRPWGLTIGTIGQRKLTAQLEVRSDDKSFVVAFVGGVVAAAASPLPSDSIARIAVTGHLVSPSQIGEITRRLAAEPERDEVEVLGEAARLRPEHVASLRHRVTMLRAARTFALDRGDFEIDDQLGLRVQPGHEVPLGAVIYQGVRMNLSEQRLAEDLREIGTSFLLRRTTTDEELADFGFGEDAAPVLEALREGTTLAELALAHREVEPRTLQAIVYALVSCGACDATGGQPVVRNAPPAPRTSTGNVVQRITTSEPLVARTATRRGHVAGDASTAAPPRPASVTPPASSAAARASTPTTPGHLPGQAGRPSVSRTITAPRTITARERVTRDVEALLATRIAMLDAGADHFAMLGVIPAAPAEAIRAAYFSLSRQLHEGSLAELGLLDQRDAAARIRAQLTAAFDVLCDPARRRDYVKGLEHGAPTPLAPRARTDELNATELAQEAFKRGELALVREQLAEAIAELQRAVDLDPANVDYAGVLAWAQFCAAPDKQAVAVETRRALTHTIHKSSQPVTARFYLGRVERMLGRLHEALSHFEEVVDLQPGHADAAAEIRVIESRLSSPGFGKSRKR